MKKTRHISWIAGAALAVILTATSAHADPAKKRKKDPFGAFSGMSQSYMPEERQSLPQWAQRKISASEAKSIALRRVPGAEVVDIDLKGNTYRVRLIRRDGRVVDVFIDAATGRVR